MRNGLNSYNKSSYAADTGRRNCYFHFPMKVTTHLTNVPRKFGLPLPLSEDNDPLCTSQTNEQPIIAQTGHSILVKSNAA